MNWTLREKMGVEAPIFLVGTGRCGSSILFEALTRHERVGWMSSYNERFPDSSLASAAPLLYSMLPRLGRAEKRQDGSVLSLTGRLAPVPSECYSKWDRMTRETFRSDFLVGLRSTEEERRSTTDFVRILLRLQRKDRFLGKITGPTRMIYLQSIFPDAQFVHVVRDGRAVVNSLLSVGFWNRKDGADTPMWTNGLEAGWEEEWEQYERSPAALAAIQYRRILEIAHLESQALDKSCYLEIQYEEFVTSPELVTSRIVSAVGLERDDELMEFVAQPGRYRNMDSKFMTGMSDVDLTSVSLILEDYIDV